ncbi:hypothetical protein GETHLI_30510 [Geothrix limicola]|uniref:Outer membrane protein beta-barrel domain-containing protein n=1 Tax=Geothrix limicola TaxID=2927978 RepID=A0ABQ5QKN5_9BACT|nr:hypothetical protein [Geothrix limicola]GLH74549.1 hypothetical protein GETHLI_30510 [Geothrix limicola]
MFSRNHLMRLAALTLAGGTCLSAQAPSPASSAFDAGLNVVMPLDTLKTITHASGLGGVTAEFGYSSQIRNTTVPFRLSVSVNHLPGKEVDYQKNSLLGFQGAADVFAPTGINRVSMVAGLSLNAWRWDFQDASNHTKSTMKGAKFGARFGFDFRVSDRVSTSLMLQMTELGTDNQAIQGYNPSWIQVGARYRF